MLPKEREEARTHLGRSHGAQASGAVQARGPGGQRHGGCRTESGAHLETRPSGLQGAPAVRGWPWRRSPAPLSAPRLRSGPGLAPGSRPAPARSRVRRGRRRRPAPERRCRAAFTRRRGPRCAHQQLIGSPAGPGLWAGPPHLSWEPRPCGPTGLAETPGSAPGAAPPGLKAKARVGLARVTVFLPREPPWNSRESSGLGAVLPPLRTPLPVAAVRGRGEGAWERRRLLGEPPVPSQRGI